MENKKMNKVSEELSYDPNDKIGQGTFGIVYSGFYSQSSPVAVKQIQIGYFNEDEVKREVEIMKIAHKHCNILKYIHFEKNADYL